MTVKIIANDHNNPPGKLADAELHFTDGPFDGLKLIGFAIWERRTGGGVAGDYVTFWFADPAIVEQIAANTQIELYGSAGASVGTSGVSTIAVSWDGSFEYSQTECESKNHRLILTRR